MSIIELVFGIAIFSAFSLGAARRSGWSYARSDDLNYLEYGIAAIALIVVVIGAYLLDEVGLT